MLLVSLFFENKLQWSNWLFFFLAKDRGFTKSKTVFHTLVLCNSDQESIKKKKFWLHGFNKFIIQYKKKYIYLIIYTVKKKHRFIVYFNWFVINLHLQYDLFLQFNLTKYNAM